MKQYAFFLYVVVFLMLGDLPAFAGQTTLTTYYPAPDGNYNHLTANNIGIAKALGSPLVLALDINGNTSSNGYIKAITTTAADAGNWSGYFQNAVGPDGLF